MREINIQEANCLEFLSSGGGGGGGRGLIVTDKNLRGYL